MFELKKIITAFLVPPGLFVLLLTSSGIWFLIKKSAKEGLVTVLLGGLVWSLSISPVSNAALMGLESGYAIPQNPGGDVIILLGGGIYEGARDFSGTGSPSEEMTERIVTAVRLQKKLNIPIIVSGGKVFNHRKAEAPVVKRFLFDLGVPEGQVLTEDESRDTLQNAIFTMKMCTKLGYREPIVVTSASHMKRAMMSFETAGMKVLPFPAGFKSWSRDRYGWEEYLPGAGSLRNTAIAIKEYIGILYHKLVE